MPNRYTTTNMVIDTAGKACAAASTTVVSDPITISGEDSRNILVNVTFSAVNEVTGVTTTLQDSHDGGTTWAAVQSASAVTTVAKVDTFTFPTKAGATASDYFTIYDADDNLWSCALDVTGSDTAPTGALWVATAAGRKVQANISGDTTAANVAASVEAAFDALTDVGDEFTTDDTAADGTMTFTWVRRGVDSTASTDQDEDDSGDGSISIANTTAGSFTAAYEIENNVYDGTDTAMWNTARVIVTTGASDTATVSKVYVSRR